MTKFEERKKIWRILYSPIVFIALLIVFIFLAKDFWRVYEHEQVSKKDRERVEANLAETDHRVQVLRDQVKTLETPQGIDEEIRSKFNVSKTGEGVAIIVDSTNTAKSASTSTPPKTFWQKFLGIFGL